MQGCSSVRFVGIALPLERFTTAPGKTGVPLDLNALAG